MARRRRAGGTPPPAGPSILQQLGSGGGGDLGGGLTVGPDFGGAGTGGGSGVASGGIPPFGGGGIGGFDAAAKTFSLVLKGVLKQLVTGGGEHNRNNLVSLKAGQYDPITVPSPSLVVPTFQVISAPILYNFKQPPQTDFEAHRSAGYGVSYLDAKGLWFLKNTGPEAINMMVVVAVNPTMASWVMSQLVGAPLPFAPLAALATPAGNQILGANPYRTGVLVVNVNYVTTVNALVTHTTVPSLSPNPTGRYLTLGDEAGFFGGSCVSQPIFARSTHALDSCQLSIFEWGR